MSDITRATAFCGRDDAELFSRRTSSHPAGGARRDRTDDLLLAKQALSQLSYGPDGDQRVRHQASGKERRIPDA
jgi:hypothetical protein